MNKFVLSAFVFVMMVCQIWAQEQWYGKQEASCLQQGGLCIAESECGQMIGKRNELCPQQGSEGFQCCFGLPRNEKRCRMHGGQCFNKDYPCTERFIYAEASDCSAEQNCCLLF